MSARESQLASDLIPGDLSRLFPDLHPGGIGLGLLRRGPRAAPPRRAVAAARGPHDDPRGVGEPRGDGPGPAGLLRVPLDVHGALGRPRGRRPSPTARVIGAVLDRNGLRPGPVLGHRRRPRRPRLRGRRARPRTRAGRPPRAGCSRAGCSSSTPRRGRIIGDDEVKGELAAAEPYEEWLHAGLIQLADLPGARAHRLHGGLGRPAPAHLRLHRGGAEDPRSARWRATGAEAIGSMGTDTPIAVLSEKPRLHLRLLHPALRPGDQPAARRHPRGARHLARHVDRPRGEPARRDARALPSGRPRLPRHRQRRARQDPPHQRRR